MSTETRQEAPVGRETQETLFRYDSRLFIPHNNTKSLKSLTDVEVYLEQKNILLSQEPKWPVSHLSEDDYKRRYSPPLGNDAFPRRLPDLNAEMSRRNKDARKEQPKSYEEMKEDLRPLVPKHSGYKGSTFGCYDFTRMFLSVLIPLGIVVVSLVIREQSYQHSTIFANVTDELKQRIYGQDQAIEVVGNYLRLNEPTLKMIALVGGTGVGKTYTTEIIESNFPKYSVRRYFSPISGTMNDVSFSLLYPKLIVLENLKEEDLPAVTKFLKTHDRVSVDQYITVLVVFNFEQMDNDSNRHMDLDRSAEVIRKSFTDENLDIPVVPYESLGEDVVKRCIVDAAHYSNIVLSKGEVEYIKIHLIANNAGCKGAHSKVQVIQQD